MALTHRQHTLQVAVLLAMAVVIAACSGSGDFELATSPTATPDEAAATEPPAPTPTETETDPTPAPTLEDVDVTQFCFAATKVGEAGELLDLIDIENPAQFEFGLTRMQDALVAAVDLAPTSSLRAVIEDSDAIVDQLIRLMEVVGYDLANAEEETLAAFVELGEEGEPTLDQLEADLSALIEDDCGIPVEQLTANAEDAFNLFFPDGDDAPPATPIPPPEPSPPVVVDGTLMLADDTGIIQVSVPETWSDTATRFPADGITRFIAAEIVQGYEESWEIPGVSVAFVTGLGVLSDEEVLENAQAFDQCLLIDTNPYSDPLYSGTIRTFEQCGQSGTNAAVVVARNTNLGDGFILVEVQYAPGDELSLDIVLNSFVVTP